MIESSKKVGPWREAIVWQAARHRPEEPMDGALVLTVAFTLARPKSAVKARISPTTQPDLSKLVRSTEDALTTAKIWVDDARVVECHSSKVWFGHDARALPFTGAVIVVSMLAGFDYGATNFYLQNLARKATTRKKV